MSDAPSNSYDEVPYDASNAVAFTHPDVLATIATLHGMSPPAVETCRVLELGCANGANLLPMAYSLPDSRLLGIDLSSRQVAEGLRLVNLLGLTNIELRAQSIMDVDETWGKFDYIICHGVYSWVPSEVQEKILAIGGQNLSDQGVFYVSYNTYPGWHVRGMIRQMMLFHTPRDAAPLERVRRARELLQFMIDSSPAPNNLHCAMLKHEAEILTDTSDSYLLHEQLEEFNQPCLFYEFAQRATKHGLQYLAESRFADLGGQLASESRKQLADWGGDRLRMEQYLDFLNGRTFRRTLLVRAERKLDRNLSSRIIQQLYLSGRADPVSDSPQLHNDETEKFQTSQGLTITTNHPVTKTALTILSEQRPQALSFEELWQQVRARLEAWPSVLEILSRLEAQEELVMALVRCFLSESLAMHVYRPAMACQVSERPVAIPLARHMATAGGFATTVWHCIVQLKAFERSLLPLLDGTRDRAMLLEHLRRHDAAKLLPISPDHPAADRPEELLPDALDSCLRWIARVGLLVG